jgi:hypothetical protein
MSIDAAPFTLISGAAALIGGAGKSDLADTQNLWIVSAMIVSIAYGTDRQID